MEAPAASLWEHRGHPEVHNAPVGRRKSLRNVSAKGPTSEYSYRVFVANMKEAIDLLVWFYNQRAGPGADGNQDGTLRAAFAPVCGATCWKPKERVPGSNFILDNRGPGGEAARASRVF